MDGTDSGSYPVADFGVTGVKTLDSATRVLVVVLRVLCGSAVGLAFMAR